MNSLPSHKELYDMGVENSLAGRTMASILAAFMINDAGSGSQADKNFENDRKSYIKTCVSQGQKDESVCEHALNNGIWQACQSQKEFDPCDDFSYWTSASDVFSSPYFWGGLGFFLGILFVTMDFLLLYCLCLKKKNKGMNTGKGSGSQETSKTPGNGTPSKTPNKDGCLY